MLTLALALALQAAAPPPPSPAMIRVSRCFAMQRIGGDWTRVYLGDRACVAFAPSRTLSGVWLAEFEGSVFIEGASTQAQALAARPSVWLTMDEKTVLPVGFRPSMSDGHAYRITFEGRPAKNMNRSPLRGYGHLGVFPGLVLADRILKWEDLGVLNEREAIGQR